MVAAKNPKVEFWSGKVLYPAIVVLFILSAFFGLGILPRLLQGTHPMVGKPAPELALPKLNGAVGAAPISLASLKGHVVVLDFWAPWCKPCREEMPELDQLARKLANEGVMVVGVLVDPDRDGAVAFINAAKIGYPQLEDETGAAARAFTVRVLPSLVVIDKQGVVRSYRTGYTAAEEVESAVKAAL